MPTVRDYKAQYPEYAGVPDDTLAKALTAKGYAVEAETGAQALASETGPWEAGLVGAGRTFSQLGRGAKQLISPLVDNMAPGGLKDFLSYAPDPGADEAYAALQAEHPLATGIGESVPYMVGGGAAGYAQRGLGLGANLLGQAGVAGGIGAAQEGTAGERLARGGIDAAIGAAGEGIGRGVGRMIAPGMRALGAGANATVDAARAQGYGVMPSTAMSRGSTLAQTTEGALESTPMGASVLGRIHQDNQALLNRAAAEALGENAEAPTDAVLSAARQRIGGEFERLFPKDRKVPVDPELLAQIQKIREDSINLYIRGEADPVGGALARLEEVLKTGEITADELMRQQSRLGKQARQAFRGENSNPDLGHGLHDIQDALLKVAERNMSEAEKQAFGVARGQWKTLSALESGANIDPVTGNVYPGRMASFLQRRDVKGFAEGGNRSPLYEGVRFLGRLQTKLPSSGTAERLGAQALGLGSIGGVANYAAGDGDIGESAAVGLGTGALGLLAPGAVARGYLGLGRARPGFLTRQAGALEQELVRGAGRAGTRTGLEVAIDPDVVRAAEGQPQAERDKAKTADSVRNATDAEGRVDPNLIDRSGLGPEQTMIIENLINAGQRPSVETLMRWLTAPEMGPARNALVGWGAGTTSPLEADYAVSRLRREALA